MKQEDRKLLLKDLSARFPYNVALDCRDEDSRFTCYLTSDMLREIQNNTYYWEYKPYLFPLSSMTEKQKKEYEDALVYHDYVKGGWTIAKSFNDEYIIPYWFVDFCNKNHFDYRGLIPMGLANDATGLNIY